jgi:hypothetical protein
LAGGQGKPRAAGRKENHFRCSRAPRRAAARSGWAVGQCLPGAGATLREGRLRARQTLNEPGVAHLAKATSLGGGARLGSGPQTTFAAYQKCITRSRDSNRHEIHATSPYDTCPRPLKRRHAGQDTSAKTANLAGLAGTRRDECQ